MAVLTPLTQLIYMTLLNADRPMLIHENGTVVWVNEAMCTLFGYANPQELMGFDSLDLAAPQEQTRINAYMRRRRGNQEAPIRYSVNAIRKDGIPFTTHVTVLALEPDQDSNIHMLLLFDDNNNPLWDFALENSAAIHTWSQHYLQFSSGQYISAANMEHVQGLATLRHHHDTELEKIQKEMASVVRWKAGMSKAMYSAGGILGAALLAKIFKLAWP